LRRYLRSWSGLALKFLQVQTRKTGLVSTAVCRMLSGVISHQPETTLRLFHILASLDAFPGSTKHSRLNEIVLVDIGAGFQTTEVLFHFAAGPVGTVVGAFPGSERPA